MRSRNQAMFDYPIRTAELAVLEIISASGSSIVQVGDRSEIDAKLRALAVQRQASHAEAGEVYFESYSVFDRPVPAIIEPVDEQTTVHVTTRNLQPRICVGCVEVIAVSSSSLILIGNGMNTRCESRVKHIRQYAGSKPTPPLGC
ncbi:spore germination protein GerPE [Paenibacillus mendelii]|nr:spore germination protein GerPE [Paenibacillus mendelii]